MFMVNLRKLHSTPALLVVFVPVMILSGYWMYSGLIFALIGVAVWLGA